MNDKYDYEQTNIISSLKKFYIDVKPAGCGARKIRQNAFDSFRNDHLGYNPIRIFRKGSKHLSDLFFRKDENDISGPVTSNLKSTAFTSDNKDTILEEEFTNLKLEETSIIRQQMLYG